MMTCIFKFINFTNCPAYLKELFQFKTFGYSLRGTNVLVLPKPKQLHMASTQLDMPQRDIGTRLLILLENH